MDTVAFGWGRRVFVADGHRRLWASGARHWRCGRASGRSPCRSMAVRWSEQSTALGSDAHWRSARV